ncbi:MAG: ATP-binding protein [Flavobacteriales bacterium]|nr:ATP-binding protein [Flavobacteriales bacterium]
MEHSLASRVFGKEIHELEYQDLKTFFTQERKESDILEFKSYGTDYKNKSPKEHLSTVRKTICALLNSDGGLLVWGAPVGYKPEGEKEKVFRGDLTAVDSDLGDDQMSDGILQTISPMPPGIRHQKLVEGTNRIYVFEVRKSPYAPHQLNGTYFARFNVQTHPAPHYLVEALTRRVTFPDIAAYLELISVQRTQEKVIVSFIIKCVNHSRLQNEENISVSAMISHGSFPESKFRNSVVTNGGRTVVVSKAGGILHYGTFQSLPFDVNIPVNEELFFGDLNVQISVGGRHSPMKFSSYSINTLDDFSDDASRLRLIKPRRNLKNKHCLSYL